MKFHVLWILLGFIFISTYTQAMEIPARPSNAIYDPQSVLPAEEQQSLWNSLVSFWNQTHMNAWFAFVPPSLMISDISGSEMAERWLQAWHLTETTSPPSQGDVLFLVTQPDPSRFQTFIAVSEHLKDRFQTGELDLVARQEVVTVTSHDRIFPVFTTALISLQNVLVSDIHLEDQSLEGRFRKFYEQWKVAPPSQKIPGAFLIIVMALLFPFALIYGKIRSSGSGSGGGGGASGGGGDFGGGGASGKF